MGTQICGNKLGYSEKNWMRVNNRIFCGIPWSSARLPNQVMGYAPPTSDTNGESRTTIQRGPDDVSMAIRPRQLWLQQNTAGANGMCSSNTAKQWEASIVGSKHNQWEYLQTSPEHYQCHVIYVKQTKSKRVSDTVFFKKKYITQPTMTQSDIISKALIDYKATKPPQKMETRETTPTPRVSKPTQWTRIEPIHVAT